LQNAAVFFDSRIRRRLGVGLSAVIRTQMPRTSSSSTNAGCVACQIVIGLMY